MNHGEGIAIVREMVARSLGLDIEDIQPSSKLMTELGADSLDLIDLIFLLERRFGVKLREGKLAFLQRLGAGSRAPDGGLVNGRLRPEHVETLRPWLPGLAELDPTAVTPEQALKLITVETLWVMVEQSQDPSRTSDT